MWRPRKKDSSPDFVGTSPHSLTFAELIAQLFLLNFSTLKHAKTHNYKFLGQVQKKNYVSYLSRHRLPLIFSSLLLTLWKTVRRPFFPIIERSGVESAYGSSSLNGSTRFERGTLFSPPRFRSESNWRMGHS